MFGEIPSFTTEEQFYRVDENAEKEYKAYVTISVPLIIVLSALVVIFLFRAIY